MNGFVCRLALIAAVASHPVGIGTAQDESRTTPNPAHPNAADVELTPDLRSPEGLSESELSLEELLRARAIACLHSLTWYISWPADTCSEAEQAFVIGVIGDSPFGQTIDRLATEQPIQRRRIVVKYFDTLADYKPCHILLVPASSSGEVRAAVIRHTRNQPVLLVGASPGYGEEGSTVNLVPMSDGTIKIEMNIDAMNRRRLRANALLLELVSVVRDRGTE